MNMLLLACSFASLLIAILCLSRPLESVVRWIYPWVPLPPLIFAALMLPHREPGITELPGLLLRSSIGLDELGRAFLILICGVWWVAGLFSQGYLKNSDEERLFRFYFLVTFSGTLGLTLAQDAPSFYAGYALMTVGGYGLIINTKTMAARLAGRVYLTVALFGEMLSLSGMIMAASQADSFALTDIAARVARNEISFWLIFVGFGTKVGLVPLHFWLPRSYYWAPLPAVAVLSGAMTKAGVLGWLRFLPDAESWTAAQIVVALGALMAFYGVIFGVLQTRAKTTLAFSSLSQMGYITMGLGALLEPGASPMLTGVVAYAFHHGSTKVALFLGLGVLAESTGGRRRLVMIGLTICSLALVGFPFTGGAYAKSLLKYSGVSAPLLTVGSIGTTLLMLRFLVLCSRGDREQVIPSKRFDIWLISMISVMTGAWFLPSLLERLGFEARGPLSFFENLHAYGLVAIGSALAIPFSYRIWIRHAKFTPRPFESILQTTYKAVWEDFPREMHELGVAITDLMLEIRLRLRVGRKFRILVERARALHTGWILGCSLFMTLGILTWIFLKGGAT